LSSEVRAKLYDVSRTVSIRGADGRARDEIYVPTGHWAIRDEDGVYELGPDDFAARFAAVPPDPASFAMRGRPVRAVFRGGGVEVEGREAIMPADEFRRLAVRLAPDSRPLCRCSAPLAVQASLLAAAGADGELHLAELRERAAKIRSGIIADPSLAADLVMMDAVLSGRRDALSDGMAEIHLARPPEGLRETGESEGRPIFALDPESVRGRLVCGTGIHPTSIVDLVHSPAYGSSTLRALARACLSPYLGERAMEEVLVVPIPPGDAGHEARNAVERWLCDADLVVEGPEIEIAEMPDYRTSTVRHFRFADGVDALAFDDVFSSYLYAWRTPAAPAPKP
jgi:hypothetical protein